MRVRKYLELKDGSFEETEELLRRPDLWDLLIAADRRLIKRYAAKQISIQPENDADNGSKSK